VNPNHTAVPHAQKHRVKRERSPFLSFYVGSDSENALFSDPLTGFAPKFKFPFDFNFHIIPSFRTKILIIIIIIV
jgi:hypothetical protein